jgi:ubiquinol-cytochrome c reductase cytochrome c1 subunit
MKMKILSIVLCFLPTLVLASGGEENLEHANIDVTNKASLQRGAKYFVNYCMGCHSLKYMSYRRLGKDLDLSDDQVENNLMFAYGEKKKMADYMKIAMPPQAAENWFGRTPPDLSVIARSRTPDWLYTYLRGFYQDDSRPFGVNNAVFPKVGMPNILWRLEGMKKPKYKMVTGEDGEEHKHLVGFEKVSEGTMTDAEFDQAVRDLVTFLTYAGEPGRTQLERTGVWVLLFLVVLFAITYALKKEYWKDVH